MSSSVFRAALPLRRRSLALMLAVALVPLAHAETGADTSTDAGVAEASARSRASTKDLPTLDVHADGMQPVYAGGQVSRDAGLGLLGARDFMETPFNTVSYTEDFIRNVQAQDLVRVIAMTDPSVQTSGSVGGITDYFSVRGFSVSSSDVGFGGLYGLIPYYRVTPELADRIEVLKGPSALLNGMPPGGSVGGSVTLVPKRAGETPLTRVTTTYASDAQFGTHVDIGRRFGREQQFGVRFNGVYRDGDTSVKGQQHKNELVSFGLDWRGENTRVSADLFWSRDHVDGLNRGLSLASGLSVPKPPRADTMLAPDWTFTDTEDNAAMFRIEHDLADDWMLHVAYGHGHTNFDSIANSTNTVFNVAGDYRNNFAHQRSIFSKDSAEVGLNGRFQWGSVDHQVALTANWYHHDNEFGFLRNMLAQDWVTNIYNPQWGSPISTAFSHEKLARTAALQTTSIGVADTVSMADERVQLTVGVRRQSVTSDTFSAATGARTARYDASATTPAVALLVKAGEHLSFYANYVEGLSQGATAPATAENAGEVFPPFKSRQREIGAKADLGRVATTLSLYEITKPNSYTDPLSNVFSFGGEQRNRGVEWSVFGELQPGLRVMGGASWSEPKLTRTQSGINQGRYATATPRWQGKLGVEWDVPGVQDLTLTGNAVAMSRQYITADNSMWVAGRTVFDLGARYSTVLAQRPLTLRTTLQNVTNKAYWAGSLGSGLGAPRTVLVSATMDF